MFRDLGLGGRLESIECVVQAFERSLIGLADLLELLHMSSRRGQIQLCDFEFRSRTDEYTLILSTRMVYIPELSDLGFQLLFLGETLVDSCCCRADGTRSALINRKFFLVSLQLFGEIAYTLLLMSLCSFGYDKRFTRSRKIVSLRGLG